MQHFTSMFITTLMQHILNIFRLSSWCGPNIRTLWPGADSEQQKLQMPRGTWRRFQQLVQNLLCLQHPFSWRWPLGWCQDGFGRTDGFCQLLVGRGCNCWRPRFHHEPWSQHCGLGRESQKHPQYFSSRQIHKTLQSPRLRHRHRSMGGAAYCRSGGQQASKPATGAAADLRQPRSHQLHQVWAPWVLGKRWRPSVLCTHLS